MTQPIGNHSPNDAAFIDLLKTLAIFLTGSLGGVLASNGLKDKPTEGDQVSDTTAPAPAVEEAVEAAKVEATAPKPSFYTTPRLEFTKSKYLEMSVRAFLSGVDSIPSSSGSALSIC